MARGVTAYTRSQRQLVQTSAKVTPRLSAHVNSENEGRKGVDDERNIGEERELWGRYRTKARELHIRGSTGINPRIGAVRNTTTGIIDLGWG